MSLPASAKHSFDSRTACVAFVFHLGFLAWTLSFTSLPLWLAAPLGSILLAWYGSLQHETIHGHPTSSRRINTAIGIAPLSLWIPYAIYRETHIRHHRHAGRRLTEIEHDPESFYLPPGHLEQVGPLRRLILLANCTLAGRLVLGPAIAIGMFWIRAARDMRTSRRLQLIWLRHALGVAALLVWTVGVCHIPSVVYALLVVYPSASITNLRSFAEHSANDDSPARTNVVEASAFWSLIFLNNNLHVAHHAHPAVPWHALPAVWRRMQQAAPAGGRVFLGGYWQVCRAYLLRPFITAEHPFAQVGNR